ncbi:Cyanamide hydratase [Venustampulla echinocandica]|uniref:Cyanamide hydratase n=1 Tax=Venustampulla echinocandica TaxID=2656787 RepID=A0A370U2V4_9HELO|nr:Cyanamide hydratase [Venustampulla echinocandica]RDL42116.1 Cyanamide hydratase [Venustampulla echinocandica]
MANSTPNPAIEKYGWTAVPRDIETLLQQQSSASGVAPDISASSITLPESAVAKAVLQYAQQELAIETFNHSMRVFYYGKAILAHAFPSWSTASFDETYFLTCLLHDIGTTDKNISATLMSFEFYGGAIAHSVLTSLSAPLPQAENVTEAIIRHQDLGSTGTITRIGALAQLATIFDNIGGQAQLVSKGTIESVVAAYPRKGWSACFAKTLRKEISLKPWAHSTHLGGKDFPEGVEGNKLMEPYDK